MNIIGVKTSASTFVGDTSGPEPLLSQDQSESL